MFRRHRPSVAAPTTPTKSVPNPNNGASSPLTPNSAALADQRTANGTIIADRYLLEKTIGKGSYGKVKLAMDLASRKSVAVKFISRSSIKKPAHMVRIRREINLLTALHHPNIVRMLEVVETAQDIILVMEYVPGADLFERIVAHPEKRYGEAEGRTIFSQIVAAIEYCHYHRVIHRDLKPENVMVTDEGHVKLIDFGFANMFHPRGSLETNCGSPLYAAPEIVQGIKYTGPEVDIWSLGVILFAILTGTLPFEDEQLKGLYSKICAGNYTVPSHLSTGAKDLIRRMLTVDSSQRLTIQAVATHPWLYSLALPPRATLLTRPPAVRGPPEERIIRAMVNFGFPDPEETHLIVTTDADDPATAIYYLLLAKQQRDQLTPMSIEAGRLSGLNSLLTPPPTPSSPTKLFSPRGRPLTRPTGPIPVSPLILDDSSSTGLASPLLITPPLLQPGIMPNEEDPLIVQSSRNGKESTPSPKLPIERTIQPYDFPEYNHGYRLYQNQQQPSQQRHHRTNNHLEGPPSPTSLLSAPASIVSQAAASVANHFKKLRGLAYVPRPAAPPTINMVEAMGDAAAAHQSEQQRPRDHQYYYHRV